MNKGMVGCVNRILSAMFHKLNVSHSTSNNKLLMLILLNMYRLYLTKHE